MDEDDFIPLQSEKGSRERPSYGWLVAIGVTGLALLVVAVLLDVTLHRSDIWPNVLLNVGSGALLFAVLFWAERRLVLRLEDRVRAAVEKHTLSQEQQQGLDGDPDIATLGDRFADDGQIGIVYRFFEAMGSGEYEGGWHLADDNWRRCRVQSFLWNNRDHYGTDLRQLDALARDVLTREAGSAIWPEFVATEGGQFREAWGSLDASSYGASSRRRTRGPGYELVVLVPLASDGSGWYARAPAMVPNAMSFLVHLTDEGWRVANHWGDAAPLPGWPPAWWAANDPAVEQWEAETLDSAS